MKKKGIHDIQKDIMFKLLKYISQNDQPITILKGGTSLMFCY